MKWFVLSWRNIWRHQRRSLLAMSIMAMGTAAILTTIGFMLASFSGLRESTIRSGLGHLQIRAAQSVIDADSLPALESALKGGNGIRFTMRRVTFEGLVSNGPNTVAVMGSGVEPEKETRLSAGFAPIVSGTGLPPQDGGDQYAALLGVGLAKKLGVGPGDGVTLLATTMNGVINAVDVKVVGTFTVGVPEIDERQVLVPLSTSQILLDTKGVSRLVVVLQDIANVEPTVAWVRAQFPAFLVSSWRDLAPFYSQVVTLYRNLFTVLGLIVLAVVLLSVTNTMLMAITERVREMGTMLALGISRARIRANFAMEGAAMGLLGGFAGLVGAAVLALAIDVMAIEMPPPPGRTLPYPLTIFIDGWSYAVVFAVIIVGGALAAWLPTARLYKLQIVEALRQT